MASAAYKNHLTNQIFDILTMYIGETIARGSIKAQCAKLGILEENIRYEHLSDIADGIRRGLVLFIGTEQAINVANKIGHCR